MIARPHAWIRRGGSHPLVLLGLVATLSLAGRGLLLNEPCRAPCRSATDHLLVFDEDYYVNASRVIAGVRPPHGYPYAQAPLGDDPNAEHPQLAKLVMAGSIELFGDGPFAWRIGSLMFGTLAVVGMFALVRAAGGDRWLALGAAALLALDNLQLVHGRIATLDVYAIAAMIWAAALYLRGWPLLAGVVVGVGTAAKEVAPYVLVAFAVLELLRWRIGGGGDRLGAAVTRLAACAISAAGVFIAILAVLDRIAAPYADASHTLITGGAFAHIGHILSYAAAETSPHGPTGIASYPWEWLFDYKPISYLTVNPGQPAPGLEHVHPAAHFLGMISPPILLLGLVGVAAAAAGMWRERGRDGGGGARSGVGAGARLGGGAGARLGGGGDRHAGGRPSELGLVSVAWSIGTFVPFELMSAIYSRTSYLYYMAIVMPGLYMAAMYLVERFSPGRRLVLGSLSAVVVATVLMYPFTPLPF